MTDEARKSKREKAALLIAQSELTTEQVAKKVGVSRFSIWTWRKETEFAAMVERHQQEIVKELRSHGIAVLGNRVKAYQDRWRRLQVVIDERAASDQMQDVPGGTTGLLVRDVKKVGDQQVDLYAVDTGLLAELRNIERQAAQELGQWVQKTEADVKAEVSDPAAERSTRFALDAIYQAMRAKTGQPAADAR